MVICEEEVGKGGVGLEDNDNVTSVQGCRYFFRVYVLALCNPNSDTKIVAIYKSTRISVSHRFQYYTDFNITQISVVRIFS